jgi:GAF domain-containing protein/HAMP domain-containing protein
MKFLKKSLMARLVIYFLLLSVAVIGLVGHITFIRAREALKQAAFNRLSAIATLKEGELNRWIDDQRQDLLFISQLTEVRDQAEILLSYEPTEPEYQDAYASLSKYLLFIVATKADLQDISILTNVGGKIVVSTDKAREGEYRVTSSFFTQGRLDTYVQNVYPSPETGKPTMTVATPLLGSTGQPLGVLAAHLNLENMDSIILERTGLGASGETYLVDRFNVFVSEARFGRQEFPRGVHTEGIDAALKGVDGSGLYLNYDGAPVIGVYRWLDDRELALLAEMYQAEAFAPARQLAWTIALIGLVSAGVLAVGVYLLARQITRPILAIADAAIHVASGDLTQTAPVLTEDEVGVLARAFNRMTGQLRELVTSLEQRVADRTRELERRATHLQAAADVGHAAVSVHSLDELLPQVTHLISDRFGFYHIGIFLLDESGEYARLRTAEGAGGQLMLARGHKLKVGEQGIVGYVTATGKARIALDVGQDAVHFKNPFLPNTRSEMALPLIVAGRVLGALDVQSTEEAAFTQEDVAVLQVLADQVAIAIHNAQLFEELQASLMETSRLYQRYSQEAWSRMTAGNMPHGYEYDRVRVAPTKPRLPPEMVARLRAGRVITLEGLTTGDRDGASRSALIAPIVLRDQVIGAIGFEEDDPGHQWSPEEVALVEAVTSQVALALENARLFEEAQARAEREQLVGDIADKMQRASDMDSLVQYAIQNLQSAFGASYVVVHLGTEDELLARLSENS